MINAHLLLGFCQHSMKLWSWKEKAYTASAKCKMGRKS
jgi:hypothetical protein